MAFQPPILDWSKNAYIAAFFSLIENNKKNPAIYCLKTKKINPGEQFKLYTLEILDLENANNNDNDEVSRLRHVNQEAVYTCFLYNKNKYTENEKTHFSLIPIEEIDDANIDHEKIFLIKYIITDSPKERLNILKSLYDQEISYAYVYGKTHPEENTSLKDFAVKEFMLKNHR